MPTEPEFGDEPIPPPTREEERIEAWEHWHQRARELEVKNYELKNSSATARSAGGGCSRRWRTLGHGSR